MADELLSDSWQALEDEAACQDVARAEAALLGETLSRCALNL